MLKFSSSVDDEGIATSAAATGHEGEYAVSQNAEDVELCNHVFERLQNLQLATLARTSGSHSYQA